MLARVPVAIITGSGGLVRSESVSHFVETGFDVVGIENDMRAQFFGDAASIAPQTERLLTEYPDFVSVDLDIRNTAGVDRLFARYAPSPELVIHEGGPALARLGWPRPPDGLRR